MIAVVPPPQKLCSDSIISHLSKDLSLKADEDSGFIVIDSTKIQNWKCGAGGVYVHDQAAVYFSVPAKYGDTVFQDISIRTTKDTFFIKVGKNPFTTPRIVEVVTSCTSCSCEGYGDFTITQAASN